MTFRGFISADIEPSQDLIAALKELSFSRADLKIVKPELLHVTLKFLGDTEEELVEEILSRMKGATAEVQPFRLKLCGMGAFPSLSNIRVIWVGIENGETLGQMAERLDTALSELGFERDKKGFKPHLTVARTRSTRNIAAVQDIIKRNGAANFGEYAIDRIILKKSVLSPQGPTYSNVRELALGKS